METRETICRLCLKTCESCKAIEGNIKDVLAAHLPIIDLAAIQKPVVCTNCADILVKYFDFKTACLSTHDYIVSFVNNKDAVELDLKDVYLSKNENGTSVPEDDDICGFCIGSVKNYSAVSLNVERGNIMLKRMIEQCLPELSLRIIKKPVICFPCHESLYNCFRFVTNCLTVEEKIKKYCETLDTNSKGQMKLSSLLQFTIKNVTSEDGNSLDKIKVEKQFCEGRENADEREFGNGGDMFKIEQMFCDDSVNAKDEVELFVDTDDLKFNKEEQFIQKDMLAFKEDNNSLDVHVIKKEEMCGENELEEKYLDEVEHQEYLLNEEIEIKTDNADFNRLEDGVVLSQPEAITRLRRKNKFLMLNREENLSTSVMKQTLANKKTSSTTMYHCEYCSYQTKIKYCLKSHLLSHKDPSEVTLFKCNSCPFQTKYNQCLKRHLLMHKDPLEEKMYKCDSCSFESNYDSSFKNHLLRHKNPSEVTMYKCDACSFESKNKYCLKNHLLLHKHPSEVTMFKCNSCPFETKYKSVLRRHVLVHPK